MPFKYWTLSMGARALHLFALKSILCWCAGRWRRFGIILLAWFLHSFAINAFYITESLWMNESGREGTRANETPFSKPYVYFRMCIVYIARRVAHIIRTKVILRRYKPYVRCITFTAAHQAQIPIDERSHNRHRSTYATHPSWNGRMAFFPSVRSLLVLSTISRSLARFCHFYWISLNYIIPYSLILVLLGFRCVSALLLSHVCWGEKKNTQEWVNKTAECENAENHNNLCLERDGPIRVKWGASE